MSYFLSEPEPSWVRDFKVRHYMGLASTSPRAQAMLSGVSEDRESWWERFREGLHKRTMARLTW